MRIVRGVCLVVGAGMVLYSMFHGDVTATAAWAGYTGAVIAYNCLDELKRLW